MTIQEKLALLPDKPGVYLFKDSLNQTLYVGKAISLRHRVHSYFQKQRTFNPRLQLLVAKIKNLDYFLCDTEMEALLLEYNLIKEHHPPYNVRFRDDKRYPLIKVVMTDPFPYITIARKHVEDGNRYFGPYVSSRDMRNTLKVIRKIFQIRSCTMNITGHDRPCLYYHLKECTAPCISAIHQNEYRKSIQGVLHFLEGEKEPLIKELSRRMEEASERLEFERAALIRNQVSALKEIAVRQKVTARKGRGATGSLILREPAAGHFARGVVTAESQQDQDYIGLSSAGGLACAAVFHIRNGKLISKNQVILESVEASPKSIFSEFILKYYQETPFIPPGIFLLFEPDDQGLLEKLLSSQAKKRITLEVPKRGEKKKLLTLLEKNTAHHLELALIKEAKTKGMMEALAGLQKHFRLPCLPFRIEGYDISNLFGEEAVGSMVVFQGGKPQKNHYRKFAIQWKNTPDDFAMMEEVLTRRMARLKESEEDESFSATPDLILLDGGQGQLSRGIKVLELFARGEIPILSLAKEEEEVYSPLFPKPVKLLRHDPGLKLLQHVRDEAHRFAISFHKKKRDRKMTSSLFFDIPGMGEKRARKLLEIFGSPDQIKVALPEQIAAALHCPKSLAEKIIKAVS